MGYALSALPSVTRVPWHRVINAQGMTSARRGDPTGALRQRLLLEAEGVKFGPRGRVSLEIATTVSSRISTRGDQVHHFDYLASPASRNCGSDCGGMDTM